eukprot:scaffold13717_cov50-Attheya_sp.AAC.3
MDDDDVFKKKKNGTERIIPHIACMDRAAFASSILLPLLFLRAPQCLVTTSSHKHQKSEVRENGDILQPLLQHGDQLAAVRPVTSRW